MFKNPAQDRRNSCGWDDVFAWFRGPVSLVWRQWRGSSCPRESSNKESYLFHTVTNWKKTRYSGEKANAIHTLHDRCRDNLGLTSLEDSSLRCQALYIIPSPITHVTPLSCLTKNLSRWVIMRIVDLISAWNFLLLNSHWWIVSF